MQLPLQLRPMSMSDMFDAAFRIYRAHFVTFVGIAAVLIIPMTILDILLLSLSATTTAIDAVQNLIIVNLISGALARTISRLYMNQPISIGDAYRFGARRFVSLIAAQILVGLMVVIPAGLVAACMLSAYFNSGSPSPLALLALIAILPIVVFVATRYLVSTQAIVLEERGAVAGLRRSWNLTSGSFWRVFGIAFCLGLLTILIATLPTLLVTFLLTFANVSLGGPMIDQAILTIISQAGLVFALPLQITVYTLLYYDLRVRKEGFDLELLAQQGAVA